MTTNIRIDVTHGLRFVSDEDLRRALLAAQEALGDVDPVEASAEYARQIEACFGTTSRLTGLALIWARVDSEANRALTEGWCDPEGAFCEVAPL